MNYLFDCTKAAFDSNPAKYNKKNSIVAKLGVDFNSYYFSSKFLLDFYSNEMEIKGFVADANILSCYERTLDFWVTERLKRLYNESEVIRIAKELNVLHNESNVLYDLGSMIGNFSDLIKYIPLILLVIGAGYLINAVKK
jgi:hypothetical protein